ncbi:hypothetical protein PRIPAC_74010, partial [Pristionchus pacificus]|uniref:Uncharacterized protein n=1 Tax=Pristionchus pacificus TaxID=54126 RepID=A0A2A6C0Z2_PRIPA
MRLVHFLGSTSVHAHFEQIIPEFTLYKLAEIVDVIKLSGSGRFKFRRDGNLCSLGLAYDILRKRCSYLDVSDTNLQLASRKGRSLSAVRMHRKPFYFAARGSNVLSLE